ncbi:MAG: prepilin-type N-terminal cleavage/methylation domain-containing protein [Bacilli bacterium]
MRQKGFTLIELVGVIVLVSLMVLIIIPTVEKAVKKGEENADKQLKDNMILAAKSWAVDNKGKMPQEPGVKINIWLSDLQKDGYIERDIKLPSTGASIDEACIEVTNKSSNVAKKDVYDYVYNDNCTINLDLVIIGKIGNTLITSGTWTNKDITLTATSSYTGTYQWYSGSTAINGATKKSYVATKGTNTEGKVTYKVKMKSEKRTPEATYVAAIDKKAPAISITSKIATKDNLTISLSETSSGSGLKGYAITSSATTPTTWTAISGISYSNTFSKATGTYYIHVKDVAGNTTYKTVSITSMDPPTCSISLSGTMGANSWYKTDVGVTLNGYGTVSTKGLATTQNSTNGVGSVTHSTDTSGVTYYGYVSNVAGSNSCSKSFKRDASAPAISVTTKISEASNLTITLQDNMSGLAGYEITTSKETPSSWKSVSGENESITVTKTTGTYYVHAKDVAGNTTYKSVDVLALEPPTCSISLSGTAGNKDWYVGDVTVNMTTVGTATTKGLATTQNSTNGKTSIVHDSDGKSITYYGYVANAAGENSCSKTFKRDATGPTCSLKSSGDLGDNGWYRSNVDIKFNDKSDSMSDVTSFGLTTSSSENYNSSTLATQSSDTSGTTYYGYVKDAAGNTGKCSTNIKRDVTPPWDLNSTYYSYYEPWGGYSHTTVTDFGENFAMAELQYQYCYEGTSCGSNKKKNCNNTSIYDQPWNTDNGYSKWGAQAYAIRLGYGCWGYKIQLRVWLKDEAGNETYLKVYTVKI